MGTSHSGAEFANKLKASATNLKNAERPAVAAGGAIAQKVFLASALAKGAGGSRGVTVTAKQASSNGHPAMSVEYGPNPGWVAILDRPTKPHFIAPSGKGRGGGLRKQGSIRGNRRATRMAVASLLGGTVGAGTSGAINVGGGVGPKAWAQHPGTKGKHFVEVAMVAAPPLAHAEMHKKVVTEFAKSFT